MPSSRAGTSHSPGHIGGQEDLGVGAGLEAIALVRKPPAEGVRVIELSIVDDGIFRAVPVRVMG